MNKDYVAAAKDALVLIIITLVAGLCLGGIYELTKEPIAHQKELAITESCKAVFPDEEGFAPVASFVLSDAVISETLAAELKQNGITVGNIYTALTADGSLAGYAIEVTSAEGYGGNIRLYMGMTLDGTVKGISILEIHETPGLGMRASEVLVPQFRDVSAPEFTVTKKGAKSDSEIDAITSATITSKAVTRGVNFGMKYFEKTAKGGSES
jgi:electron transport complex protein RnfG